jgi:SPP1 family predicted phage head-tail adaptor
MRLYLQTGIFKMNCDSFSSKAKHKIVIKKPTLTTSDMGGQSTSFSDLANVWAILEPKSGREFFSQGSIQSRTTHNAMIRYRSDMKDIRLNSNYIVIYDGRNFAILSVLNFDKDMKSEGKDFQKLLLEENGADIFP